MRSDPACVFCKIVKGDIPSHRVHEDAGAFAFLDIQPLAVGHALVVPRAHAARVADLTEEEAAALGRAVRAVVRKVEAGTGAAGATVAVNDGAAAGQEVPHVHVHVVPRRAGDGIGPIHALFKGHAPGPQSKDALAALAERMRSA